MGKILKKELHYGDVEFLGEKYKVPRAFITHIALDNLKGATAMVILDLPGQQPSQEYSSFFRLTLQIGGSKTLQKQYQEVYNQLVGEITNEFKPLLESSKRSKNGEVWLFFSPIPAQKITNLSVLEKEYTKIIKILLKY